MVKLDMNTKSSALSRVGMKRVGWLALQEKLRLMGIVKLVSGKH